MTRSARALVVVLALAAGWPSLAAPEAEAPDSSELSKEKIRSIGGEIRRWVRGVRVDGAGQEIVEDARGRIRRYDWDDPTKLVRTFTREELCRILVKRYNRTDGSRKRGGCTVTVDACLAALENPSTYSGDDFRRWKGLHTDTNRAQEHPDDAYWSEPTWSESDRCWRQDVVWFGENPRRGWHCADAHGLWGWDPKITGHIDPGPDVPSLDHDGQNGWKGAHAGYPFDAPGGCKCIIWVLPKEVYLESIDSDGRRIAVGLWDRYTWTVDPDAGPPKRRP